MEYYDPLSLLDQDLYSFPTGSYQAMAVDIDDYTNNIVIGYRLTDGAAAIFGAQRSWVVEITPDMEVVSTRQVFIIDADHQDFELIDVEKYAAQRLCTAEAPAAMHPTILTFGEIEKSIRYTILPLEQKYMGLLLNVKHMMIHL